MRNVRDAIELGHLAVVAADGHAVVQTSVLNLLIVAASLLVMTANVLRDALAVESEKPEAERARWVPFAVMTLEDVETKLELDRKPGGGAGGSS